MVNKIWFRNLGILIVLEVGAFFMGLLIYINTNDNFHFSEMNLNLFIIQIITFLVMFLGMIFLQRYFRFKNRNSIKKKNKNNSLYKNLYDEFEKVYNQNEYKLKELKSLRNSALLSVISKYLLMFIVVIGIFLLLATLFRYIEISINLFLVLILTFIIIIFSLCIFSSKINKYQQIFISKYKEEIIKPLVSSLNNQLQYNNENYNKQEVLEHYKNADFKTQFYDSKDFSDFYQDDCIEGYLNSNMYIKMVNINVYSLSIPNGYRHKVFEGVFSIINTIDINGFFFKTIEITSKNTGRFGNLNIERYGKINSNNEEFNKYFEAYSDDKSLAMKIFTPNVIENIVNIYKKYGIYFNLKIKDGYFYIRFFTDGMFEPNILMFFKNKQALFEDYYILKSIIEMNKEIALIFKEIKFY